jgi:hypothetical protein
MRFTLRPAISDDAPATGRLPAELGYRVREHDVRVGLERAFGADDGQVIAVTDGDELVAAGASCAAPASTTAPAGS